jgi:hypothetical protein
MTARISTSVDPLGLVSQLLDVGNVDTVYRDVYLQRARSLMAGVLSIEEFRRIEQDTAELATLPLAIGRALEKADWARVKELSERSAALRGSVEGRRREVDLARGVYAVSDVRLDPFSPGLLAFVRLTAKELPALRSRALEHLAALERVDPPWTEFYARRRAGLQAVALPTAESSSTATASLDPREAAQHALKAGDMRGLARLAERVMAAVTPSGGRPTVPEASAAVAGRAPADLLTAYSEDTLKGARRLGLAARRLESRVELASLRQYAWNPLFADESGRIDVNRVPLPAGTPEAFRERLEMLIIHPLVNSGGARHLPTLVAEDVLVEDFPDPKEGDERPPPRCSRAWGWHAVGPCRASPSSGPCSRTAPTCWTVSSGSIPAPSAWSASHRTSICAWARPSAGDASPSGPTSTATWSWPTVACGRWPGATCATAVSTTCSASAATTTRSA